MPKRVAPDDLVSALLMSLQQRINARSLTTVFPSRWFGHGVMVVLSLGIAVLVGTGTGLVNLDYSSLDISSSHQPTMLGTVTATPDDVLVKSASTVTQLVNRPRQGLVTHIVQEGETISSIAEAYSITPNTVIWANGLQDGDTISPDQNLIILPVSGVLHKVAEGETIEDVAQAYQSSAAAIVDFNQLTDPEHLVAQDELVVPGGRLDGEGLVRVEASARTNERSSVAGNNAASSTGAQSQSMRAFTYEVAEGDTLGAIAERNGIKIATILQANGMSEDDVIQPGQQLTILPVNGIKYTVQNGDTLTEMAERFQADPQEIVSANQIANADNLPVGQELIIPGGKLPESRLAAAPNPAPVEEDEEETVAYAPVAAAPAAPAPQPAAPASSGSSGSTIVGIASQYLGYPYVWGGSSPSGFDCSGFTYYVYQQAGVGLAGGHDLWGQLQSGPRVSEDSLAPGDLVFFENTYTSGLSHVGIYIGGGRFIHAASESTGVRVNSLGESYWSSRYFGGSRPW